MTVEDTAAALYRAYMEPFSSDRRLRQLDALIEFRKLQEETSENLIAEFLEAFYAAAGGKIKETLYPQLKHDLELDTTYKKEYTTWRMIFQKRRMQEQLAAYRNK